jgi:hypothetical protein
MPSHQMIARRNARVAVPLAAIITSILAIYCSIPGAAMPKDPPWIAKDWKQWTQEDCEDVFTRSPWSHGKLLPMDNMDRPSSSTIGDFVEFSNALPIREAALRQAQLESHYDKMTADQKQAFDRAHIHDLDPTDQVLVFITNNSARPQPTDTTVPVSASPVSSRVGDPASARQAALRLSDGTLVPPKQTNQVIVDAGISNPINEYKFVFPRAAAGKPLFSPTDSYLVVELGALLNLDPETHEIIPQPFQDSGLRYSFKISELMYKGKLEY